MALPTVAGCSNKNVEKQRSYQSLKKKKDRKVRFGNPSSSVSKEIRAKLLDKQSSETSEDGMKNDAFKYLALLS